MKGGSSDFAHALIDMWVPDVGALSKTSLYRAIRSAAASGGLTVLQISSHTFKPRGLTVFALLSQSHIAIHTWPEMEFAACDVFSCGGELDKVTERLVEAFAPRAVYQQLVTRGRPGGADSSTVFLDETGPGIRTAYDVRPIARYDSQFQHIEVLGHHKLGRMLVINRDVQFSTSDHDLYDHALMAPIVPRHRRSVLIVGGGDGLCATYLLDRLNSRRVVVLEIDPLVLTVCKRHFRKLSAGLTDPRCEICVGDATQTIRDIPDGSMSAVVIDTTAPDTNTGEGTYGRRFLREVKRVLEPGGQLCMNGTSIWFDYNLSSQDVFGNLKSVFASARATVEWIPSFGSPWSFFHARKEGGKRVRRKMV